MFGVDQVINLDRNVYGAILNPSGYLNNSDTGYYIPYLNQGKIARENLAYQYQNLFYQQQLQQQLFTREDSSIQRRVADLTAAGLSPVLAAGQGAGSGSVVTTSAPQRGSYPDLMGIVLSLMKMEADISKTNAERDYIELQKSKVPAEIANLKSSAYSTYQKARQEKVSADTIEGSGVPGDSIIGKSVNDAFGALKKAKSYTDKINSSLKSGWNIYDSAVGNIVQKAKNAIKERASKPSRMYDEDKSKYPNYKPYNP